MGEKVKGFMIKHQLFIGAALVAGVAIGYFAAPQKSSANVETEETYVAKSAIADSGEAASIAALRARIAELEAKLAGKGEESAELIANAVDRLRGVLVAIPNDALHASSWRR